MDEHEDEWQPWIEMETIRDPMNPWALLAFAWVMLMVLLTVALFIRGN